MSGEDNSILFLLRLWPVFGGGETVSICLANEFVKRGYDVHVLYFKETETTHMISIDSRIIIHKIEGIRCDELSVDENAGPQVSRILIEYINKNQINVVINQWWPVSYIKDIKSETDAIVIKCNHTAFLRPSFSDSGVKGVIKNCFKNLYFKRVVNLSNKEVNAFLPYADKYVFLSKRFVEQYLQYNHNKNIEWVNSIPNPLVYDNDYDVDNISQKESVVLFVGRIVDDIKRLSIALKAWSYVERHADLSNWKFIIVGDGPDRVRMEELSKTLSLQRVTFEGFQKPESYYKNAKILVQTSRYEGFGMTILEAQQCGCVPLAMDTFLTVHDLIQSGENGIIVDDNQKSFTMALISLMKENDKRGKMAQKCLISSKYFHIGNIVDKWKSLFDEIRKEKLC